MVMGLFYHFINFKTSNQMKPKAKNPPGCFAYLFEDPWTGGHLWAARQFFLYVVFDKKYEALSLQFYAVALMF